jgi:eukaryotic-like serine/threonine-protein kinase
MDGCGTIIPLELGHYRLIERIGGSAYGAVWRAAGPAFAPLSMREVALKLVNETQMAQAQPALRQRWVASAEAEIDFLESLAPWDERHIVRLLDCGRHRGLPVMALELMSCDLGRHVQALRHAGDSLPLATVLAWMGQLNQALGKVHQYGWRHLDLKPGNVLVDIHQGLVKLADFGANRRLAAVQEHSYGGTASWQAPEQFFPAPGGGYLTAAASDYFALGALFYFMVTGGVPLQYGQECSQARRDAIGTASACAPFAAGCGQSPEAAQLLLDRHGGAMPPTLLPDEAALFAQSCGTAAGPALALLRRLLDADPAARPRHALEISRALAAIAGAMGAPAKAASKRLGQAGMARDAAFNGLARSGAAYGGAAYGDVACRGAGRSDVASGGAVCDDAGCEGAPPAIVVLHSMVADDVAPGNAAPVAAAPAPEAPANMAAKIERSAWAAGLAQLIRAGRAVPPASRHAAMSADGGWL